MHTFSCDCHEGHEHAKAELRDNSHDETPGDELVFHRDCIYSEGFAVEVPSRFSEADKGEIRRT